jgi:hypothetical protein
MARHRISLVRAAVEIAFIIFLFYSNLLMGEFDKNNGVGKTWKVAFANIVTGKNFGIALVAAVVGFAVFEALREKTS